MVGTYLAEVTGESDGKIKRRDEGRLVCIGFLGIAALHTTNKEQKREKILEQYNLGLQTDASKKTLNDWFDEWMELYVVGKVKPRTVQNYIREYERCKSYIGHKHIKMMKYYTHLEENFVNKEFDKIREKM